MTNFQSAERDVSVVNSNTLRLIQLSLRSSGSPLRWLADVWVCKKEREKQSSKNNIRERETKFGRKNSKARRIYSSEEFCSSRAF